MDRDARYASAAVTAVEQNRRQREKENSAAESRRIAREAHEERKAREAHARERLSDVIRDFGGLRSAARVLNASPAVIQGWANVGRKNARGSKPSYKYLVAIAAATGCSLDWLCGFDVRKDRPVGELSADLSSQMYAHTKSSLKKRGCSDGVIRAFMPPRPKLLDFLVGATYDHVNREREAVVRAAVDDVLEIARRSLDQNGLSEESELALYRLASGKQRTEDRLPSSILGQIAEAQFVSDGLDPDGLD